MQLEAKSCEVSDSSSFDLVSKTFDEFLSRSLESKLRVWSASLSKISDASLIALSDRRQDENSENEVAAVLEE